MLARNIAHAATMTILNQLAQSSDWRVKFQARAVQRDLGNADEANTYEEGEGAGYRAKAQRSVVGLAALLCRGWQLED